ncbi:hypothetical protein BDV30DRAFT_236925 [Aspergillus minisclerotigenes]|uniref:Uncharacterized protein n=1 Tax=Aspergillus minisclerotigenes TaxID=656917 RepID=A0A5N6JBR8_9EURO|nr:hypothetical protein BDV30DRAFT_236925 [Aspergillus minisclerotigenes]
MAVTKVVEQLVEHGKAVVLVMRSYGGIAVSFMCSITQPFCWTKGNRFWRHFGESPNNDVRADGRFFIRNGAGTLYSDLAEAEAKLWESRLIAQSYKVQTTPATRAAYEYIPSTYLTQEAISTGRLTAENLNKGLQRATHPPISDGQLWQIARDAVDEMISDRLQYGTHEQAQPKAMAILAWGNEIILASSMKGAGSFSYDFLGGETPVGRSLQQRQIVWRDTIVPGEDPTKVHNNRRNCAEPLAAHLYYKNRGIKLQDQKARISTWVMGRNKDWAQTDPCETNSQDTWGCNLFTANQGLKVLDRKTPVEPYTLASLAGGPTIQDQIQLCGGQARVFVG